MSEPTEMTTTPTTELHIDTEADMAPCRLALCMGIASHLAPPTAPAPHVNWRRPADDMPAPGCPVLACYGTAPALVYITPGTLVWADWTTGIQEPTPDYWAELPPTPTEDQ